MGWEVYPDGLRTLLKWVHDEYDPKSIYITENGAAYSDGPDETGRIKDTRRIEFMRGHIVACHRAIQDGVPLRGYFAWSLMDNFEWAHGYHQRFGIVWVDFATQERIPKDSALYFAGVARTGGV